MRVTFLVREGNSELVRAMPQISEMISYEPSHLSLSSTTFLKLVKRVRIRDFNVTFLLGSEFNFARSVLALATGAKIRIGFTSERTFPFIKGNVRELEEIPDTIKKDLKLIPISRAEEAIEKAIIWD